MVPKRPCGEGEIRLPLRSLRRVEAKRGEWHPAYVPAFGTIRPPRTSCVTASSLAVAKAASICL